MNSSCIFGNFSTQLKESFDVKQSTIISFKEKDQEFPLLSKFCSEHNDHSFRLKATKPEKKQGIVEKKEKSAKTELVGGLGLHQFQWEGHKLAILIQTHGQPVGSSCGVSVYETATLFYPNSLGKQSVLHEFVEYLIAQSHKKKEGQVRVYSYHKKYQYWKFSGSRLKRPITSVILDPSKRAKIVGDIADFLHENTSEWYAEHGIPYKRSYMFHGPPGSGKSSLIHALASHFDRNICFLQPCHELMTDDLFKEALQDCPDNSIIVLEDIDSLFTTNRQKLNNQCPLTFSGFLNGIDGFGSPEGQLFMMTTNYLDRLDSALTRAGRVDLKVELGTACYFQVKQMFLNFYPDQEEWAETFATKVCSKVKNLGMASIQNHFIQHRKSDAKAAATDINIGELVDLNEEHSKDKEKQTADDEEKAKKNDEKEELDEDSEKDEQDNKQNKKVFFKDQKRDLLRDLISLLITDDN
jgi:chaperone BCS1